MQGGRRSIGQMPYLRRQDGLCSLERREEHKIWVSVVTILAAAAAMGGANPAAAAALGAIAGVLMLRALAMRALVWAPNPPINRANCNRGVASFSDGECWRFFRYRRADLPMLIRELNIPAVLDPPLCSPRLRPAPFAFAVATVASGGTGRSLLGFR